MTPMPKSRPFAALRAVRAAAGAALLLAMPAVFSAPAVRGAPVSGESLYRRHCASCHGTKGEGSKQYRKALTGTQSAGQLALFISKSMPPGNPRSVVGDDARRVAAYIHGAFYSPVAQARNRPPRVELARLTVGQYRNAVADLIGGFRRNPAAGGTPEQQQGLRGEYYNGRRIGGNRALERVDPEIRFDFGTGGPAPALNDPYQFSIRWQGSVLAPDSGEYEFVVRTDHAIRLWVNNQAEPVIDAWVKSGSDNVFAASLRLLGGRRYPLRLEFSKSNQGVDNQERLRSRPPAPATVSLEWRRPGYPAASVIPSRFLAPATVPETFVVTAPFPPDDRSEGYERGTSVSREWDAATTEGAIETAGYVAARLDELSGARPGAPDRAERLRAFCREFAARAFRRPLTEELQRLLVDRQLQGAADAETGVKRVVLLVLKSPRFLFRELGGAQPDAYDVAARLSFGLWDSLPDEDLLKAAAAGALATREQVASQAERMTGDPRAHARLMEFFHHWLKLEHNPELAKDPKRFPGFDDAAAADLRSSLELFLEDVTWKGSSDFRQLLLDDRVFLNGRLARIYGANLPADAPFQPVSLDAAERAGVLTHPYLMASFAYLDTSSPIHRGVLLARSLLGRTLQPPPEAFTPLPAELHPKLTTRQRVALQTRPAACMSCHGMINPLGFTMEKFDAIGRFRAQENGMPVDTTGSYEARDGRTVRFAGVRDLAKFLAGSPEAHAAFTEQLFQHMVKQPAQAYGPDALVGLQKAFAASGYSIRRQLVETMAASALVRSTPARRAARP